MATGVALECHKLCVRRCVYAVLYSICAQFVLLTSFLLFAHISPLQPIAWLHRTASALVSPLTWLRLVPLVAVVVAHGILLGKAQLSAHPFHANRFTAFTRTVGRRTALLAAHAAVGLLTAWLCVGHLPTAYSCPYAECAANPNRYCLNERYALLLLAGCFEGIYYFVRERCRRPVRFVRHLLLSQARYLEMRTCVNTLLGEAARRALLPAVVFAVAAYTAGGVLTQNVARCFGLARETQDVWRATEVLDVGQLLFTFVIGAQIVASMRLIDHLFNTFLTERMVFAVEAPVPEADGTTTVVTLVQALAADSSPLLQELAALDLVALCERTAVAGRRRQQVFALSVPGGHPYNWTALCGQCLAQIDAFREELRTAVELALPADGAVDGRGASTYLKGTAMRFGRGGAAALMTRSLPSLASESASEMAAKLMMRQYNETYGIRNMTSPHGERQQHQQQQQPELKAADPCRRFNEAIESVTSRWSQLKEAVLRMPGIHYMFGVDAAARLTHLLAARCQATGDTVHGLAGLAVHSLHEDRYGVVQADLARIVHALLQLRAELERIDAVPLRANTAAEFGAFAAMTDEDGGAQRRSTALRGTVKRSLGQLAAVFGEYLPDLLTDAGDIRTMEAFAQFRET